jgi:hypothetical protein
MAMSSVDGSATEQPAGSPVTVSSAPTALAVFRDLDAAGIRCSQWKGSVRLEGNIRGGGDLDLLVHPDDVEGFRRILGAAGWQPPRSAPTGRDALTEDHFLLDEGTGRIVHIDASAQLRPDGFARVLPGSWSELILGRRRRTETGVPVPDPAVEAALLLLRLTREGRPFGGVLRARRRRPLAQRHVELSRLLTEASHREVLEVLAITVPPEALPAAADALFRPTRHRLASLRQRLGPAYGRTASLVVQLRPAREGARRLLRGVNTRWLHLPVLLRRSLPAGGMVVAIVGSDGSGKSSLVRRLTAEYASKFDTLGLYLGSGDGPASMLRLPLKLVHSAVRSDKETRTAVGRPRGRLMVVFRAVWALTLAREKRLRLRRAELARARGLLVICDRYPQVQYPGENDGPLLSGWWNSRSPTLRRLARIERRPYDLAASIVPDLVVRLDVDEVTAHRRRPGSTLHYLAHRRELVRGLEWDPASTRVVSLDATAPAEEVFRLASAAIWEARRP